MIFYPPLKSSRKILARGMIALKDIMTRVSTLSSTTVNVLIGRYTAELYGHRYLLRKSLQALRGVDKYPFTLEQAREAVRLLEMAFKEVKRQ